MVALRLLLLTIAGPFLLIALVLLAIVSSGDVYLDTGLMVADINSWVMGRPTR